MFPTKTKSEGVASSGAAACSAASVANAAASDTASGGNERPLALAEMVCTGAVVSDATADVAPTETALSLNGSSCE
jgi:hypothetical protein